MSCTTTGGDAAPVVTEIFFAIESAFMQKSKKEEKKSQPSKSSADKIKLIAVKKGSALSDSVKAISFAEDQSYAPNSGKSHQRINDPA